MSGGSSFVQALAVLALQPFSELLRAELVSYSTGHAELTVPLRPILAQQHGFVHGGVLSYAADNTMLFAASSVLGPAVVSTGLHLDHIRPVRGSSIRAVADVITVTGLEAVCRCEVLVGGDDGESLCVVAQGTVRLLNSLDPQPS